MRSLCCCVLQNIALGSFTSMLSVRDGKEMCQNQRSTFIVKPIASLTFVVPWVVHCLQSFLFLKCLALLNKRMKKQNKTKNKEREGMLRGSGLSIHRVKPPCFADGLHGGISKL